MNDLTGKTALVTGGSRGIGRAIAERLAADGALVAVHYGRNETAAKETVAAIERAGGRAFPVGALLGVDGDVDALFERLERGLRAHTGGTDLDIVVNNAGGGEIGTIEQVTPEDFDRLFALNVRAPFFVIKRAMPLLRDGGRIVNISSAVARMAISMEVAYGMSKGAVEVMSRTMANALGGRGITVNAVAPGMTRTDMSAPGFAAHPETEPMVAGMMALGRIGEPDDIAAAVAFLASEDGRWVTGHVLDASGGTWLGPII
ncbi:MAG TPA: SDR family oxidoreductase [Streptosporangiaceae bacterium]|jgi:NAD(P)-dependent dehydrogenase (short-subunit alcohol dehydrogenase family)